MRFSARLHLKTRPARKRAPVVLYNPAFEAARSQHARKKVIKSVPKKAGSKPEGKANRASSSPSSSASPFFPSLSSITPYAATTAMSVSATTTPGLFSWPAPDFHSGLVEQLQPTAGALVAFPCGGLHEALLECAKKNTGTEFNRGDAADLDEKDIMAMRLRNAGAGEGEVAISMMWENTAKKRNDLDLYVTAPSGETISYSNKRSKCGGVLDVDGLHHKSEPVKNIVWAKAPKGSYSVYVHVFSASHDGPMPFKVGISLNGSCKMIDGFLPAKSASSPKQLVTQFDYN